MFRDFLPDGEGRPDRSSGAPDQSSADTNPLSASGAEVQASMAYEANAETRLLPSRPHREALGRAAMHEAKDDPVQGELRDADEGRRDDLLRLAADVQRLRDMYRGEEAQAGGGNAPTAETVAGLTDAIREIAAAHNEANDYGILEEDAKDPSGAPVAQITASVNYNEGPSSLLPVAKGLDVKESHYMVRASAAISAGDASSPFPEADENALYYQVLLTEEGPCVQRVEVHLPPPGASEMRFVGRVPLDQEVREVPDLLRRAFELRRPEPEAAEALTDGPEPTASREVHEALRTSRFLGGYVLHENQEIAAEAMAGAADAIVARHYSEPVSPDERVPLADVSLEPEQEQSIQALSAEGQQLMDRRYGTVLPSFRGGYDAHLGYNNGDHTRTFADNAAKLSAALDFPPTLTAITDKVVPPWHDADQTNIVANLPRLGEDEQRSAELLVATMRREGLPKHLAEVAAHGILGTWVVTDAKGVVVGQWGGLPREYPSKDAEMAARSAATADLAGIYSPRGPYDAHLLYAQRQGLAPGEVPSLDGFGQFLAGQAAFLEGHRFPAERANTLFTGLKSEVIAYNEKVRQQVEAGTLENPATFWRGLLQQDIAFMREHG